ncbi:MAG: HYR domain-containing protein, partial [Casimicrobiaceae bacterium]
MMDIQGSLLGGSAFTDLGNKTTNSTTMVLTSVTSSVPMRYIKLKRGGTINCEVDGVFYNFGSNTDGIWSGNGVSGSTFNPAGLSGNVNVTYTSYGHSSTHAISVNSIPVAGSLVGGYTCPGTSFTATLQGQSGGSISWQISTNGGSTWLGAGSNSTSFTLPSVTLTTLLKATSSGPPCPAAISNTVTITPGDTTPPILDPCPANITVNVQHSGNCGAAIPYTAPLAHNSCGAALPVTRTGGLASGSTFPFGTSTITHSTTQATHTVSCSFTVTVNDMAPPTFSVGATPTLYLGANGQVAIPDLYPLLSGVADCSGVGTHSQSPSVGTSVSGDIEVTLHVRDLLNNDTSIIFVLPVLDTIPPTIACATVAPIAMVLGQCGVNVVIPQPTHADNTGWTSLDSAGSIFSGSLFPVGTHNVTYTVTDPSGLTASCTSSVVITVAAVPALTYPSGVICQTAAAVLPSSTHPAGGQFQATPSGLALNSNTGAIDPQSSTAGTYQVTLLYAGPCPVTTSATVVIEAPVHAGTNASLTLCSTDASVALFPLLGSTADTGGSWTLGGAAASNILNPAVNSSGTYIYTVIGGSACGNATASVAVTVHTTPSPAWTVPPAICSTSSSIDMNSTINGTTGGAWSGPGISGHSFDPALVTGVGNSNTYTVNYTVTVNGCTASQTGGVTVVTKPVPVAGGFTTDIICPGTAFSATLTGDLGGVVTWKKSTNGGSSWATTGSNSTSITLPAVTLTTLLKANVTSAPCTAAVSNIITITPGDTTPPILDPCPGDITVDVQNSNICGATITYTAPLANNSCGQSLMVTRTNGLASGSTFPFGTTMVTHSTTQATHSLTCSFNVTVNDMAPPTFSVAAAPTLYLNAYGQAAIPDLYALLSGVTDCSGVGVHSQIPAIGTLITSGTAVTLHVADVLNNDTSIIFTVPVVDTVPPTIACANIAPVQMVLGQCGAMVVIPQPTYGDNTGITALDSTGSIYSGSLFPVGTHTVTYTVTDPSGLTASCTSTVE